MTEHRKLHLGRLILVCVALGFLAYPIELGIHWFTYWESTPITSQLLDALLTFHLPMSALAVLVVALVFRDLPTATMERRLEKTVWTITIIASLLIAFITYRAAFTAEGLVVTDNFFLWLQSLMRALLGTSGSIFAVVIFLMVIFSDPVKRFLWPVSR